MKGVVFNIFEGFIEKNLGEDAWDEILENSGVEEDIFVGPNTYKDESFLTLVTYTLSKFKLVPEDTIFAFGKYSFPLLVAKIPELVSGFKNAKEFLMGLDSIIHIEVKKLLPGADTPRFFFKEEGDDTLILEYVSKRNLPDFARGLISGLAEHYQEKITVEPLSSSENKHTFKVHFDAGTRKENKAA